MAAEHQSVTGSGGTGPCSGLCSACSAGGEGGAGHSLERLEALCLVFSSPLSLFSLSLSHL